MEPSSSEENKDKLYRPYSSNEISVEIKEIRNEIENMETVVLLDWELFEEMTKIICCDKMYRLFLSLIVQTEEERFNRVDIPIFECFRRIIRIINNYNETNELPIIFENFDNIVECQRVLEMFTKLFKPHTT